MTKTSYEAELSEELYLMVYSYINFLTTQYPHKKKTLNELTEAFVFMRPLDCTFFKKHITISKYLLEAMIGLGIHDPASASSFKALAYINKRTPNMNVIPFSDLATALLDLKDRVVDCPAKTAIPFLANFMAGKFYSKIFSLFPKVARAFQEEIISKLSYTKQMESSLNCIFFDDVKYAFLTHFTSLGNTLSGKTTFICSMNSLIKKIWDLAIPELSCQNNLQSILWISNLLIEFRKITLFNASESISYHYEFIKKIVYECINTLKQLKEQVPSENIPEKELMDCIQGVTRVIAVENELGYTLKDPRISNKLSVRCFLPKSIKDQICSLMVEWLSSLDLPQEQFASIVSLAEELNVFKEYRKELRKFKQKHK